MSAEPSARFSAPPAEKCAAGWNAPARKSQVLARFLGAVLLAHSLPVPVPAIAGECLELDQAMTSSANRIRILIVDDHPILREGIAALLASEPDMHLVAQGSNGHEAIEQFRAH